jgi:hypothetical protein
LFDFRGLFLELGSDSGYLFFLLRNRTDLSRRNLKKDLPNPGAAFAGLFATQLADLWSSACEIFDAVSLAG